MKDHETAQLVNRLTAIAREFGQTQQLRERIAQEIRPLSAPAVEPVAVKEAVAKAIYEQWVSQPGYKPWVERGNSLMQDKARDIAGAALSASPAEQAATQAEAEKLATLGWQSIECDICGSSARAFPAPTGAQAEPAAAEMEAIRFLQEVVMGNYKPQQIAAAAQKVLERVIPLAAPAEQAAPKAEPRPLFDPEFPSQGYVTDAQWAARKVRSPAALLDKIEICAFSCEAGPLVLCEDWQRLREILAAQPVAGHQGGDKP